MKTCTIGILDPTECRQSVHRNVSNRYRVKWKKIQDIERCIIKGGFGSRLHYWQKTFH